MGQYYKIVNVDKREMMEPYYVDDNGMKLLEFAYNGNSLVNAIINKMAGEWSGDRVYVVGDYADLNEPGEACHMSLKRVLEELKTDNLYDYAETYFKDVSKDCDTSDHGYRYIYNDWTGQYIDMERCPIEYAYYHVDKFNFDNEYCIVQSISPLVLLLAMGNGRGCGDYYSENHNSNFVGFWCSSVQGVFFGKELLEGYREFAPDFTENKPMIPFTEKENEIRKAHERALKDDGWY